MINCIFEKKNKLEKRTGILLWFFNTLYFFKFPLVMNFIKLLVTEPILYGCDGVENSNMKMDSCGVCGGDNSTCNSNSTDCQGNMKLGLLNFETCGEILDINLFT